MKRDTTTPGEKPPVLLKDIAKYCGLSKFTISAALHGDPRVKASTRERVCQAAVELGYNPNTNDAARRLAYRKGGRSLINRTLALAFPRAFHQTNYFVAIFGGVLDVLTLNNYSLLVTHLFSSVPESEIPPAITRGEVDGLIGFLSPHEFPAHYALLSNIPGLANWPAITVMLNTPGFPSVVCDDVAGAYLATRHLLELGHRHIAHFLSAPFVEQQEAGNEMRRFHSAAQALRDAGLDPARHLHRHYVPSTWMAPITASPGPDTAQDEQVGAGVLAFLRANPHITAILTPNDGGAQHVWYTLTRAGIHVPGEISIIGFDDTDPILDEYGHNILTTVRQPLRQVGQQAAHSMIAHITNQAPFPEIIRLPVELIVRQTTAPPKA